MDCNNSCTELDIDGMNFTLYCFEIWLAMTKNIDQTAVLSDGWKIIADHHDGRQSARKLCRLFAEVLQASTVGMEFSDTGDYSWKEQVDQIGFKTSTGFWERPFAEHQSRWFFDGGKSFIPEFSPILDLLTLQWRHHQRPGIHPANIRLSKSVAASTCNPSWFSVSRLSRRVLYALPMLYQTLRPLLLIGEQGSGKTYLAKIIHRNNPFPATPFKRYKKGIPNEEGTLFIPDWDSVKLKDRKALLEYKQRIIATTSNVMNSHEILQQWKSETDSAGLTLRIPSLRERQEDIPLLINYFP